MFLVDKTAFVRDWWQSDDVVTLVCRPRRFGKTLVLSMVECFFSTRFASRGAELFEGLDVWDDLEVRELQGTIPTVRISLANAKGTSFEGMRNALCDEIAHAWRLHATEIDDTHLGDYERGILRGTITRVKYSEAAGSLNRLCELLHESSGSKVIVLIDEYDTPLQEAWVGGCWEKMVDFVRGLFNSTLKTNPYLGRALVTGITHVAEESIFSDMNNLEVIDTFSDAYATSFGFIEQEVIAALSEFSLGDFDEVRCWYDGFSFGSATHIYNPWSVTKHLKERTLEPFCNLF